MTTKDNVFDVINNISYNKDIINTHIDQYNAFVINKSFSLHPDTILYSNEMNMNHHLPNNMQHDYLFHSIRSRKRWSKWPKKLNNDMISIISTAYNCSINKAIIINRLLTNNQREQIKLRYNKGGTE